MELIDDRMDEQINQRRKEGDIQNDTRKKKERNVIKKIYI